MNAFRAKLQTCKSDLKITWKAEKMQQLTIPKMGDGASGATADEGVSDTTTSTEQGSPFLATYDMNEDEEPIGEVNFNS